MRLSNTHPALRRCWHPVARSGEVTDRPSKVRLLGESWVLYRVHGRPVAFLDRCPHRFAPLSLGERSGDDLRCAYHGWCFDDSGRCVEIPALGPGAALPPRARLTAPYGVTERYGLVFLAPETPLEELPPVDSADDPGFEMVELVPTEARVGAGQTADNFLDFAHFPFLHRATIGTDESAFLDPYSVEREGLSFTRRVRAPGSEQGGPGRGRGDTTARADAPDDLLVPRALLLGSAPGVPGG